MPRVSLGRAVKEIIRSSPWRQLLVWAVAITVLPIVAVAFAAFRIRYARRVLAGDGSVPAFDWDSPLAGLGVAFSAGLITALIQLPTMFGVYWGVIRPLRLPFERTTYLAALAVLFAIVLQTITLVLILPSSPQRSRLRHVLQAVRVAVPSFSLASFAAMVMQTAVILTDRLPMPYWTWEEFGLKLPRIDEPRQLAIYYGTTFGLTTCLLLGHLVVTHLFAQFGSDAFDDLSEASRDWQRRQPHGRRSNTRIQQTRRAAKRRLSSRRKKRASQLMR